MSATSSRPAAVGYHGVICPHPPILLPEIGRGRESEAAQTRRGMEKVCAKVAALRPRVVFCVTPHGPAYRDAVSINLSQRLAGSMADFGAPACRLSFAVDGDLAERTARALERAGVAVAHEEKEREQLDHGCFVPLWFIRQVWSDFSVVRLTTGMLPVRAHQRIGAVIRAVVADADRKPLLLASSDLSHVLRADGPYGFHPDGPLFDRQVEAVLRSGKWGGLADLDPGMVERAAQCGLRPLAVLAGYLCGMDQALDPGDVEIFSHEGPYGVGYLTAYARGESGS